jgi:two-component system, OmpR family, sensor histidine kinase KdpD
MTTGAANPEGNEQRGDVEAVLPARQLSVTASLRHGQRPRAARCREARRPGRWVTNAQAGPWWLALRGLARQAARATEADRGRAALLAAVSHDLRAPLAAAKAAVSGLRLCDARLTAEDREELLAAAEESLDLLAHLAASLLDVSRLQAGALAVFPRPADLGEIVAGSLDGLGPRARTVLADIPPGLGEVMADPAIMERVIANLVGNALRYSPAAAPPLVTARARGDRVQLRVVDHGPGIPKADRKRVFLAFHRLGDPGDRTGVGLGLVVSRGLAEAMGGTVEPEETPGGGLTMVVSLPAAFVRSAAEVGGARRIRAA